MCTTAGSAAGVEVSASAAGCCRGGVLARREWRRSFCGAAAQYATGIVEQWLACGPAQATAAADDQCNYHTPDVCGSCCEGLARLRGRPHAILQQQATSSVLPGSGRLYIFH